MRWNETKVEAGSGKATKITIYLFLYFGCSHWFSFNVSSEDGGLSLLSRGDCHQFASWHLSHPLQIWTFEMQIQLHMSKQIKKTQKSRKYTSEDKTFCRFFLFIITVSSNTHTFYFFFQKDCQGMKILPIMHKTKWLYIYLVLLTQQWEKEKSKKCCFYLALDFSVCASVDLFD